MYLEDHVRVLATDINANIQKNYGNNGKVYGIDPMTILVIFNVIMEVIKLILKWYSQEDAVKATRKLGFVKKFLLRMFIKSKVKNKELAKMIYKEICNLFSTLSEDKRYKLFYLKSEVSHE